MSFCYKRLTTRTTPEIDHADFTKANIVYRTTPRYIAPVI